MKKHRAIIACVLALCLMLGAAAPASAHHGDCRVIHDCIPNLFEIVRAAMGDFSIYNIPADAQPADDLTVCPAVDAEHCPDPITCATHSACHTASYADCPDRDNCATHSTCVASSYDDCLHHGDCPVHHAAASTANSTTHHSGHHGGHH